MLRILGTNRFAPCITRFTRGRLHGSVLFSVAKSYDSCADLLTICTWGLIDNIVPMGDHRILGRPPLCALTVFFCAPASSHMLQKIQTGYNLQWHCPCALLSPPLRILARTRVVQGFSNIEIGWSLVRSIYLPQESKYLILMYSPEYHVIENTLLKPDS